MLDNTYADPNYAATRHTARAILIRGDQILLMERWRGDEHYFSIPGGGIEPNETPEQAVLREITEETSVVVKLERLVYTWHDAGRVHYFYLCTYVSGEPKLPAKSEEASKGKDNRFEPKWVSLSELQNIAQGYWEPVFSELVDDIKKGFSEKPKLLP